MKGETKRTQCSYHLGNYTNCVQVELTPDGGRTWQGPQYICGHCLAILDGLFRYFKKGN